MKEKLKPPSPPAEVAAVFVAYPAAARRPLLALRDLIFATALAEEVGPIRECLKWGEPAYLTESGSGTTIRLAWSARRPQQYGLYVNCQTDLIVGFRDQFGDVFTYDGTRGLIFGLGEAQARNELAICIAAALTYHRRRKRSA